MALNDAEAHDQIDQMVRFIKQEAQEKASEIAVSAEEVRFKISLCLCSLKRPKLQNWCIHYAHASCGGALLQEHVGEN